MGVDPHNIDDVVHVSVHSIGGFLAFSAVFLILNIFEKLFLKHVFLILKFGSFRSHQIGHRKSFYGHVGLCLERVYIKGRVVKPRRSKIMICIDYGRTFCDREVGKYTMTIASTFLSYQLQTI